MHGDHEPETLVWLFYWKNIINNHILKFYIINNQKFKPLLNITPSRIVISCVAVNQLVGSIYTSCPSPVCRLRLISQTTRLWPAALSGLEVGVVLWWVEPASHWKFTTNIEDFGTNKNISSETTN